jgi:hypothetical protein
VSAGRLEPGDPLPTRDTAAAFANPLPAGLELAASHLAVTRRTIDDAVRQSV